MTFPQREQENFNRFAFDKAIPVELSRGIAAGRQLGLYEGSEGFSQPFKLHTATDSACSHCR